MQRRSKGPTHVALLAESPQLRRRRTGLCTGFGEAGAIISAVAPASPGVGKIRLRPFSWASPLMSAIASTAKVTWKPKIERMVWLLLVEWLAASLRGHTHVAALGKIDQRIED